MDKYIPNKMQLEIFNRLSWTADTKHKRLISDEVAVQEVQKEIEQVINHWLRTTKI